MSRAPHMDESAAQINRRRDNDAWPRIEPLLQRGCTLHRPAKLQTYFPHDGRDYVGGTGGISQNRVRKLEREGILKHAGVDRYALSRAEQVQG